MKAKKNTKFLFFFFLVSLFIPAITSAQESLVATFYGGWARNKGDYIWSKDHGQGAQLVTVADVNGDGFDDALTSTNGTWEVALSETYIDLAGKVVRHFSEKETWIPDFGPGADRLLTGDLDGDMKFDIAVFYATEGRWIFAVSTGADFTLASFSLETFGNTESQVFFEDVTGDGKADAITFSSGTWQVAPNNGNGFNDPVTFIANFGSVESVPLIADVDKDGSSDAIHILNGTAMVAKSNGTSFYSPSSWKSGLIYDAVMVDDADGDKKADLILYNENFNGKQNVGRWDFYRSNGENAFEAGTFWCSSHGSYDVKMRHSKGLPRAHKFFTGHVQASKASEFGASPIAFNNDYGHWQVMPPWQMFPSVTAPDWYCSWQYNNRAAIPFIEKEYYGYDADDDTFAIAYLVKQLADAEIDFVLLDQTNPWGALLKAHQLFALEISKWNKVPGNRKVKYAICGKYKNIAGEVEESAENTLKDFFNHPEFGGEENYQYLDGKPLLVCYGGVPKKYIDWANYSGSKINASNFTLKWMDGNIWPGSESMDPQNPGNWYGWYLPEGTIENSEQMVVQPGFYNGNAFTSRWYNGIEGDRYRKNWDKVLLNAPKAVTIISFVGDPEQNDVFNMATGKYPYAMNKTEHWSYPEMYWEMTRDYIQNYRKIRKGELQHIAEYGKVNITGTNIAVNFSKRFTEAPAVFATIEGNAGFKKINITGVTTNSFYATISGADINADQVNWFAVLPGTWKTPGGLKLEAGRASISQNQLEIQLEDHFENIPALFSMLNSSKNGIATIAQQSNATPNSFDVSLEALPGNLNENEIFSWIAVEAGKTDMWSGRYFTALINTNSGQENFNFTLPRYFFDKVFTGVKSSSAMSYEPVVVNTTNNGGDLKYQQGIPPLTDTINIICFDGNGGCLYGSNLQLNNVSDNQPELVKIFPNPVQNYLNIEREDITADSWIEIFSVNTKNAGIVDLDPGQQTINVSQLAEGMYVLKIITPGRVDVSRFIKMDRKY